MRVVVYELNELPWRVVDAHVGRRPNGAFARLCAEGACLTTRVDGPLHPWVTWPTLHRGVRAEEHGVRFPGQDPTAWRRPPLWRLARAVGLSVGVFGSLMSGPREDPGPGGFFVPDLFAQTDDCVPAALTPFQAFQRAQLAACTRLLPDGLDAFGAARVLPSLVRAGLRPQTAVAATAQLADERRDPRRRYRRPAFAARLGFDLFSAAWRVGRPAYAAFFTNHLAWAMHRYWRASFPADFVSPTDDPFWAEAIPHAMDLADAHLDALLALAAHDPDLVVVVAGSMGQAAWQPGTDERALTLADPAAFVRSLGHDGPWTRGRALEPDVPLHFPDRTAACAFETRALAVTDRAGLTLFTVEREGSTVFVHVNQHASTLADPVARVRATDRPIADLGLAIVQPETPGTGQHVPDGALILHGRRLRRTPNRAAIPATAYAPTLLGLLGVPTPAWMTTPAAATT